MKVVSIDHKQANNLTRLIIFFFKQRIYFYFLLSWIYIFFLYQCEHEYNFLIYFYLDNLYFLFH